MKSTMWATIFACLIFDYINITSRIDSFFRLKTVELDFVIFDLFLRVNTLVYIVLSLYLKMKKLVKRYIIKVFVPNCIFQKGRILIKIIFFERKLD